MSFLRSVSAGDLGTVIAALEHDPTLANSKEKPDKSRRALHYAVAAGQYSVCEALLAFGADPNVHDADGVTPLHEAAAGGSLQIVRLLVEAGANTQLPDNSGYLAFNAALNAGNKQLVDYLRDATF